MPIDHFIISVYCIIEKTYRALLKDRQLRTRGPLPALSDPEVLTMLVVGEYLGLGHDKTIWSYFKNHWFAWFPKLGCRTTFTRQSANLAHVYELMQQAFRDHVEQTTDLYLFDGFPIPVCHIKRYKRTSPFMGQGAVGYCAAKDQVYFGFKGHVLVNFRGLVTSFSVTPANVDERDVMPEVTRGLKGDVLADKGLIRPKLTEDLASQGLALHTPLRKNMNDPRPKELVASIMNLRRKVETVIGQLVERFNIQAIKAKDRWHLMAKIGRKIMTHTICYVINSTVSPDQPLQFENLVR